MGPETLAQVLRPLTSLYLADDHPDLLVGLNIADDAAVLRVRDDLALVMTVDFFPPVVDDPTIFGAIAATNALGDVYAMGGQPLLALNIAAFPDSLDPMILSEILRGGAEQARRGGVIVAGGHTVTDAEPKYGMAVIGTVDPDAILTKGGVRPDDALILTKAIGTGIITTAHKQDAIAADGPELAAAVQSMTTLLGDALRIVRRLQTTAGLTVHAATDVTGFGLLGHALEMIEASPDQPGWRINVDAVPLLPGARELAARGIVPGGTGRNLEHVDRSVDWGRGTTLVTHDLLADPQTAGGLLIAVAAAQAPMLVEALAQGGIGAVVIGQATTTGRIEVVSDGQA